MAFRGRGRGRGGRGFGFEHRHGNHAPFVPFPEDIKLPEVPTPTKDDVMLIRRKFMLENFWKGSCYYLTEDGLKSRSSDSEIQRYSDTLKQGTHRRREKLSSYVKLTPSNFPPELIQGTKRLHHDQKRLRWDRDSEAKKLDLFEKLELSEKSKGNNAKEKKEDSDNEDGDRPNEAEEESDDDGDYNQNIDFDDDDDDLNVEDEETEDVYE